MPKYRTIETKTFGELSGLVLDEIIQKKLHKHAFQWIQFASFLGLKIPRLSIKDILRGIDMIDHLRNTTRNCSYVPSNPEDCRQAFTKVLVRCDITSLLTTEGVHYLSTKTFYSVTSNPVP